jgi:hypothetical protein
MQHIAMASFDTRSAKLRVGQSRSSLRVTARVGTGFSRRRRLNASASVGALFIGSNRCSASDPQSYVTPRNLNATAATMMTIGTTMFHQLGSGIVERSNFWSHGFAKGMSHSTHDFE